MHVILGILGAIVSVLYLLDRLGIDLGWINPWSWRHRRNWRNKFEADPIYSIENPMDVAAILIVGTAKLEGDLSAEQKQAILTLFKETFSLDDKASAQLLGSATHLLGAPQVIGKQLDGLAGRHEDTFSPEQAESMIVMMEQVAEIGGSVSQEQREYIDTLRSRFQQPQAQGTWA